MEKLVTIREEETYKLTALFKGKVLRCFTVSDSRDGGLGIAEKFFFPADPHFIYTFKLLSGTDCFQGECRDILY